MLISAWDIDLFGGLKAGRHDRETRRFQTRKVGSLLGYLAYYAERHHPRELLVDRFWPEMEPEAGRHNLRQTLFSLRRHLEPTDVPAGSVLIADRDRVSFQLHSIQTDTALFQRLLQQAEQSTEATAPLLLLEQAISLYQGELLSGFYDEWIFPERVRLTDSYVSALSRVATLYGQAHKFDLAIDHMRIAQQTRPFEEALQQKQIELYLAAGRSADAREQYQAFAHMLHAELGAVPSFDFDRLLQQATRSGNAAPPDALVSTPRASGTTGKTPKMPSPPTSTPPQGTAFPNSNLPALLTRFFGREAEIGQICGLIDRLGIRLLSVTGPGGSGKTRLALEATRLRNAATDTPVHFVPLADLSSPGFILDAIIRAIGLQVGFDLDLMGQLVTYFQSHPTLLLLDNFEHLVEGGAEIVQCLLERVPTLHCLITSRRRLALPGEREMALSPLPIPTMHESASAIGKQTGDLDLLAFPSVAMFVDRAQAARPDFGATERTISTIGAICSRLEGIPLAIELAAARMGALSPGQMLTQLDHRLDLLVDRRRGVPERHRSLRATIDWSYSLLSPELQAAFMQLSVFRAGWTLESAAAVLAGQETTSPLPVAGTLLEWLEVLRQNSLILVEERGETLRFRMLETLREYALEQFTEGDRAALHLRYADYFLRMAEEAGFCLRGPEQALWYEKLAEEHDNLRSALVWLSENQHWEHGLRIAVALSRFWEVRGHFVEGKEFFERFLTPLNGLSSPSSVPALHRYARIVGQVGDMPRARQMCEESARQCRALGDLWTLSEVLTTLSSYLIMEADSGEIGVRTGEEAIAVARTVGNKIGLAEALSNRGSERIMHGDVTRGMAMQEESLALFREVGDSHSSAVLMNELAFFRSWLGEYAYSRALLAEALAIARSLNCHGYIAHMLCNLGMILAYQGEYEHGKNVLKESLALRREHGLPIPIADTLNDLATLLGLQGDFAGARVLNTECLTLKRQHGFHRSIAWVLGSTGWLSLYEGDLDSAQRDYTESLTLFRADQDNPRGIARASWGLGRIALQRGDLTKARDLLQESLSIRRKLIAVREICETLEAFALLFAAEERDVQAALLLGAMEALRAKLGMPYSPVERPTFTRCLEVIGQRLGETDCHLRLADGRTWTMEHAVELASTCLS